MRMLKAAVAFAGAVVAVACGGDQRATSEPTVSQVSPCALGTRQGPLQILGCGLDTTRFTAEIAVRGATAYTSSWQVRQVEGNRVAIWDVSGNVPVLVDSVIVDGAITTGDVQVSDDGKLLVVATEYNPGSIAVYDLANPRTPVLLSRFSNDQTVPGVHTAKLGRVNGTLYAFLSVDPANGFPAREVVVDLSDPSAPRQVAVRIVGNPFVHDTFPRDGLLFVALWHDGMQIWDIGGGGAGGTPANPVVLGTVHTVGECPPDQCLYVHNVWWYHDASGGKRFAFVGEEGPATVGSTSRGDIHVIDVSDLRNPKEVAYYHVPGAGTHNFSVDEANGVLYAAYYNAGVRAIDVRGDLGTCPASQQNVDLVDKINRCDLTLMGRELAVGLLDQPRPVYVWGVSYQNGALYASDMLNGIWKLKPAK